MNLGIMRSFGIATACLGLTATAVVADDSAEEQSTRAAASELLASRIAVGYRINPVELRLRGKNRLLVGLGSYLVNAAAAVTTATRIRRLRLAEIRSRAKPRSSTPRNSSLEEGSSGRLPRRTSRPTRTGGLQDSRSRNSNTCCAPARTRADPASHAVECVRQDDAFRPASDLRVSERDSVAPGQSRAGSVTIFRREVRSRQSLLATALCRRRWCRADPGSRLRLLALEGALDRSGVGRLHGLGRQIHDRSGARRCSAPPPARYLRLLRCARRARLPRTRRQRPRGSLRKYAGHRAVSGQEPARLHGRHSRNGECALVPVLGRSRDAPADRHSRRTKSSTVGSRCSKRCTQIPRGSSSSWARCAASLRPNFQALAEKFDFSPLSGRCAMSAARPDCCRTLVARRHPHLRCVSFDLPPSSRSRSAGSR